MASRTAAVVIIHALKADGNKGDAKYDWISFSDDGLLTSSTCVLALHTRLKSISFAFEGR
jgi:hypothetical protein